MYKHITVEDAVKLVKDHDTVAFNGQVRFGVAERFYYTLAEQYNKTGSPKSICHLASSSFTALKALAPCKGLLKKLIVAHWAGIPEFHQAVLNNEFEAYSMPQGILALNYDAAASRVPGFLSRAGVHTSVDPRDGTCGFNEISTQIFAAPVTVGDEEFLFYHTITPDICVLRGTTCDAEGNISMEKECGIYDALSMAMAAHNNGGLVIVQVERITEDHINPHNVCIPGCLVDYVYTDPDQIMMDNCVYEPLFAGNVRLSEEEYDQYVENLRIQNTEKRKRADIIIARRAALELNKGDILNLGIGLPMLMAYEGKRMGILDDSMTITLECGAIGGMPIGYIFGANANISSFIPQAQMFRLYEGQGIDVTGVGALEIDESGNVNVLRIKDRLVGLGGFNHVSIAPKKLMVLSTFMVGSDVLVGEQGYSYKNGFANKFCRQVENVSFSGDVARKNNKDVLYITERAVFRLHPDGMELVEIAPGVDIENDILAKMDFTPIISDELKEMPAICFDF